MRERFQHTRNGASVYSEDFNLFADEAARADDYVLAELVRMGASGKSRGYLPSGVMSTLGHREQVSPGSTAGHVAVKPARFVVRPTPTTPTEQFQIVESGILVGATDEVTDLAIPAGAAAPRWDLIQARVEVGATASTAARKIKDPLTSQVITDTVIRTTANTVTLEVVEGATGSPPALPGPTADSGNVYFVPLCWVRVPTAYDPTSYAFTGADILEADSVLALHRTTGGTLLSPASAVSSKDGALLQHVTWAPGTARPQPWLPPSMSGGESIFVPMNLGGSTGETRTFVSGDIVDDSRNWSNRYFRWFAAAGAAGDKLASADGATSPTTPSADSRTFGQHVAVGIGQSFAPDSGTKRYVARLDNANLSSIASGSSVDLYVDPADGYLKIDVGTTPVPGCQVFIWIDATAPYDSAN